MKTGKLIFVLALVILSTGCNSAMSTKNTATSAATSAISGASVASTSTSSQSLINVPNCSSLSASAEDQQALSEISTMTQQQCRTAYQNLDQFYQATENMTEVQRQAYFAQISQGVSPAPPPPPAPCSIIADAIRKCAQ